jgi:hypothetical protein
MKIKINDMEALLQVKKREANAIFKVLRPSLGEK